MESGWPGSGAVSRVCLVGPLESSCIAASALGLWGDVLLGTGSTPNEHRRTDSASHLPHNAILAAERGQNV